MDRQRVKTFRLSERRVDELAAFLCSSREIPEGNDTKDEGADYVAGAPTEALPPANDHLADDMFIAYALQTLPETERRQAEKHLGTCPACAQEALRLLRFSQAWEDGLPLERLRVRLHPAASAATRIARPAGGEAFAWTSMRTLLLPRAAYGQGQAGEEAQTLSFPITDEDRAITLLEGKLERQGRDYYAHAQAARPEYGVQFGDRSVMVTITDPGHEGPVLQRRIEVGVTVLLGTDLRLTEESRIEAHLLPLSPADTEEDLPGGYRGAY